MLKSKLCKPKSADRSVFTDKVTALENILPMALALIQHLHLPEYTTSAVSRSLLNDLQQETEGGY